jgi:hypothetical protein
MNEQNFSNHAKVVPGFMFLVLPVLLLNLVQSAINWKAAHYSFAGLVGVLLAIALIRLAFFARAFALGVQDRVIRLEERLRYQQILPEDLKSRIGDFTVNQLVALRFASDAELPALAREVLDGKVDNRKAIKRMVQNWRPDFQRV